MMYLVTQNLIIIIIIFEWISYLSGYFPHAVSSAGQTFSCSFYGIIAEWELLRICSGWSSI